MTRPIYLFCTSLAVLLMPNAIWASTEVREFDLDGSGELSEEEFTRFYSESQQAPLTQFDLDIDGRLSGDEIEVMNEALASLLQEARREAESYARESEVPAKQPFWGFLVRGSNTDVDLQDIQAISAPASGATFTMTEDLAVDSRAIAVKGAVLRPVRLGSDSDNWLLPGIEVNRLTNETQPEREIDSLTLRVGSEFTKETKKLGGGSIHWRFNPLLTTNFGFDVDVRAIEVQFEPRVKALGLGEMRTDGPFEYEFRAQSQFEYGEVFDAGKRMDLREGDSFSRLGVKFGLNFKMVKLSLLEGLEGSVSYEWFADLSGDLRARQLFTAGLSYQLLDSDNLTLETKYTRGDTSVALEDEESWTIGLGVKL